MKKIAAIVMMLFISLSVQSKDHAPESGHFSLGMRTTLSLFSDEGFPGYGTGGQFRIRFAERLNSEWFADYLVTPYASAGKRVDGHVGWSVMFYPFAPQEKKFVPYIIAGHCFDFTRITPFNSLSESRSDEARERKSSATQAGLGLHYNVSDRFDFSLTTQYMIHLGNELETEIIQVNGRDYLVIDEPSANQSLEGHLLVTLSLNYRLADLWK